LEFRRVIFRSPLCPSARQCGGCQLQALSYEQQLTFKEKKIRGSLERIGGFTHIPMEPIMGMEDPWHYRNKAQFPVGRNRAGKLVTGFYAGRTHVIVEDRKSTRLNSSHVSISYAVFCLKKKIGVYIIVTDE